jgi:hypothetical protein
MRGNIRSSRVCDVKNIDRSLTVILGFPAMIVTS